MNLNICLIACLVPLGLLLQRVKVLAPALRILVIYITYPCLLFAEGLKLSLSLASASVLSILYLSGCFLWSWFTSLSAPPQDRKTIAFNSTFLNSIFLPFPLILTFYGDLSVAVLFSIPIMVLHNTLGIMFLSAQRNLKSLFKALSFPPLVAFLCGFCFKPLDLALPPWFEVFGRSTVYLSLIFIGLYLPASRESLLFIKHPIPRKIFLNRMLFSPLFMQLMLIPFSNDLMWKTLTIESLMPPAITNAVIMSSFGLDVKSTSQSLFLPTFISLAVVTLLRMFGVL